jgi:hypothetical protein
MSDTGDQEPELTRDERLRRVVIIMAAFARNLAYVRAAANFRNRFPRNSEWDFWVTTTGNALDIATLEWCKLIGDKNDKHHWSRIVTDPAAFEAALHGDLCLPPAGFADYVASVRRYRDKFVAHLDSDRTMDIPDFDVAEHAVRFYHAYLVEHEVPDGVLLNLPSSPAALATYYKGEERTSSLIFHRALPPAEAG